MNLSKFGIKLAEPKEKLIPYITVRIVGDYNDGDYIETNEKIRLYEEDADDVKKTIKFLKKNMKKILKPYFISEPDEEDEDIREEFMDLFDVPFCVDDHCHTIESIEITYTDENGITRKVELKEDPYEDDYEYDFESDFEYDDEDEFEE